MTTVDFIPNFLNKIKTIRDEEFIKNNTVYEEKVIEKKSLNENLKEFRQYQYKLKKKASLEKMKPGNMAKGEYDTSVTSGVDILEDDIFNLIPPPLHNGVGLVGVGVGGGVGEEDADSNDSKEDTESKIDISLMDREKKINLIREYIVRKNIYLEEEELKKIDDIVDNPEIMLKKYLNISKMYQQITKISFIKKLENGSYIVDISDTKKKINKKYFLVKK